MASARKASLLVAASVAAVEALKDQVGLCRWNYAIRMLQQRAKHSATPFSQATKMSAPAPSSYSIEKWRRGGKGAADRARRTDESLSKVMYWDCWGPK
ncbi:hypothetical protein Cni_G05137 [Canna indica]|uniref:Wound induced protein n=1 Tax=Canna indica TaxID=4628 RepID=A0AAQ3Q4N0_9LILI|nr:hypothetical protein Cni_G05137 [Canna indica]